MDLINSLVMFSSENSLPFLKALKLLGEEGCPVGFLVDSDYVEIGAINHRSFTLSFLVPAHDCSLVFNHGSRKALVENSSGSLKDMMEKLEAAVLDPPPAISISLNCEKGMNFGVEMEKNDFFFEMPSKLLTSGLKNRKYCEIASFGVKDLMDKVMELSPNMDGGGYGCGFKLMVNTVQRSKTLGILNLEVMNWPEDRKFGESQSVGMKYKVEARKGAKAAFILSNVTRLFVRYLGAAASAEVTLCRSESGYFFTLKLPGTRGVYVCYALNAGPRN